MNHNKPRIPPLPRDQWTDEARSVFAYWGEPGAWENGSKLPKEMVMAQHPKLALAFNAFGHHCLLENTVPPRPRQLAILRVASLLQAQYIWHFHVGYALTAGLTAEEVLAIHEGPDGPSWADKPDDAAALRSVDELINTHVISDHTWAALSTFLDTRQLMDLVYTIGSYITVAWAVSSFGITLGDAVDAVGFDLKTASGNSPIARQRPRETEDWSNTGA